MDEQLGLGRPAVLRALLGRTLILGLAACAAGKDGGDGDGTGDTDVDTDDTDTGETDDTDDTDVDCAQDPATIPPADTGALVADGYDTEDAVARGGCDWPPGNGFALSCTEERTIPVLTGSALTETLDHLVLIGYAAQYGEGTPCVGAADPDACAADLAAATDLFDGGGRRLVSSTGGVVRVWDEEAEVLGLLGVIDTPVEAMIRLWHASIGWYHNPLSCWEPAAGTRAVGTGWEVVASDIVADCAPIVEHRTRHLVAADGEITEVGRQVWSIDPSGCVGRRPAGLVGPVGAAVGRGALLARHAALEAASVVAFRRLEGELEALGAPADLRRDVARAARDEARHARQVGALARRYGAAPAVPEIAPARRRDVEAIAEENLVEGCVGETLGALVGLHQAATAADPAVAATLRRLARDEIRHAALSWRVHAWLWARLDDHARRRLEARCRVALDRLAADGSEGDPVLGLPGPAVRRRWLAALAPALVA